MASAETGSVRKRPGGRSARVRAAVLMAALDQLAEGGNESFSCEAVAERAGVHKTTVYRRWGTRERLMLDALVEGARVGVPAPDSGSFLEDLVAYGTTLAAMATTPAVEAMARAVAATREHDAAFAEASRSFWSSHIDHALVIVERAVARGEIPPEIDPRLVIETLIAPIYFRLLVSGDDLRSDFMRSVAQLIAAAGGAGHHGAAAPSTSPPSRASGNRGPDVK